MKLIVAFLLIVGGGWYSVNYQIVPWAQSLNHTLEQRLVAR